MSLRLTPVEIATAPDFEGSQQELEALLIEGLNSGEPVEAGETLWSRLKLETDAIAAEHLARKTDR
jgi:hypothetical protein